MSWMTRSCQHCGSGFAVNIYEDNSWSDPTYCPYCGRQVNGRTTQQVTTVEGKEVTVLVPDRKEPERGFPPLLKLLGLGWLLGH